jgi:hypothetical protein
MKPCKHCGQFKQGDMVTNKGAPQPLCRPCKRVESKKWREANPDMVKANNKKHAVLGRDKAIARARAWYLANREKANARLRDWRKEWAAKNPGKLSQYEAARRASVARATPAWADDCAVRNFYALAGWLTKETGELWTVDHIVPLKSDLVCGLHVEHNLRVIKGSDNFRKSNQFTPGQA